MSVERAFADTNLFLRFLTDDVPEQADAVERLLERAGEGEIVLVSNSLVIAEIVWTLESFYGLSPNEVKQKVLAILNTPGLEVVDGDLVLQAIAWHVEKSMDFIDGYNSALLLAQDLEAAYSFDRKHFSRVEGLTFRVPGEDAL